jgi:5'-nucleotidase
VTPLEVSGLTARVATETREGRTVPRLDDVRVGEAPLDDARTYLVLVNGFLAQGGDGYAGFRGARATTRSGTVREAVRAWLGRAASTVPDRASRLRAR